MSYSGQETKPRDRAGTVLCRALRAVNKTREL
jgi:hypothetical protein